MKKLAVMFAGQGSQYQGMGLSFVTKPMSFIDEATKIWSFDVHQALLGEGVDMHQTRYTQPLVFMASLLAYQALSDLNPKIEGMTGFSLGEYTALHASGVYDLSSMLSIILSRALFMEACAKEHPGTMAAILGLDRLTVDSIVSDVKKGVLVAANYNSPQQIVISGTVDAVDEAIEKAKALGAKRAIMLKVSGAFHSPLMASAGDQLYAFVKTIPYEQPKVSLYLNTTAKPLVLDELHERMRQQLQSSVEFVQTIETMTKDGFTHFLEVGPGTVLSGLVKKINPDLDVMHLDKKEDLEDVKGWLETHGFVK